MSFFRTVHRFVQMGLFAVAVLVSGFFLFAAPSAYAANTINHQINYQGKLLDSVGAPVSDGAYQIKISLYSTSSGGTPVWTAKGTTGAPTALTVTTTEGLFTVLLGDTSVSGGSQNAFAGLVDWNNDSLYLGLTVSPDTGEMTPRKHLGAVPQAFNSEQLQGMYASSTATSGNALFIVNQTTNDAATSARTALEVRTSGTSDVHDYLIRGLASGSSVFTVSRSGTVTSTNVNVTGGVKAVVGSTSFVQTTTTNVGTMTYGLDVITRGRYTYVLSSSRNLDIVDTGGANGIGSIGRLAAPAMDRIALSGNYIFGIDSNDIYSIDITSSTAPVVRATTSLASVFTTGNIVVEGQRLYVRASSGIKVYDCSDPIRLRLLGSYSITNDRRFAVQGNYLYYLDALTDVIRVLNVTDPAAISEISSYAITDPGDINIQGSTMAVTRSDGATIDIIDIANPTSLRFVGSVSSPGAGITFTKVLLRGRYLFTNSINLSSQYFMRVYDIGTPQSPVFIQIISERPIGPDAFDVAGNTLLAAQGNWIGQYPFAQAEFSGLKAHLADIGRLDVRGGSVFEGTGSFLNGLNAIGGSRVERLNAYASGTNATFSAINAASTSTTGGWGAYINTLLIGSSSSATGTANYQMVATYNSTVGRGICVDDTSTASTCPTGASTTSIVAEGAINGLAFDLAERYAASGDVLPGDLLTIDVSTSTRVTRSSIPYDPRLFGIVSTKPGFLLGEGGDTSVALAGRVPTHVSMINGPIAIGDPLTSSQYPGLAMKATKPGRIIGYALESAETTSTIEVFVKPGYDAGSLLSNDGTNATINDDLLFDTQSATVDQPLQSSSKLIFRGRAWNGIQALAVDYWLGTEVGSTTSSKWGIHSGTSTLFSIDSSGNAEIQNDLVIGGRLYPSARGVAQHDKYIFMDTGPASSTYMATNADGWQANDSYDFAERYYSPDALTPGDVVVVSRQGKLHVQRSVSANVLPVGIVSTKPGFVTGAPASSTYPIALAGRVPTKVSTLNGSISVGDLLAPSTVPGIAVKATSPGPVIGQALESYSESDIGLIEVFVHAGWWGGAERTSLSSMPSFDEPRPPKIFQGLALMQAKATKVHISFPSTGSYPLIHVTPQGELKGGWWTEGLTHEGFDLILKERQDKEILFAWQVQSLPEEAKKIPLSDGTFGNLDLDIGTLIYQQDIQEEQSASVEEVPAPSLENVPVQEGEEEPEGITTDTETATESVVITETPE